MEQSLAPVPILLQLIHQQVVHAMLLKLVQILQRFLVLELVPSLELALLFGQVQAPQLVLALELVLALGPVLVLELVLFLTLALAFLVRQLAD